MGWWVVSLCACIHKQTHWLNDSLISCHAYGMAFNAMNTLVVWPTHFDCGFSYFLSVLGKSSHIAEITLIV